MTNMADSDWKAEIYPRNVKLVKFGIQTLTFLSDNI